MPERTCSVEGCSKALRARGLCSTHYNQQHQPHRHAKVTIPCGWCEQPCEKEASRANRYDAVFCSLACRDAQRLRQSEMRKLPALFVGEVVRRQHRTLHMRGRVWVAGWCADCGAPFVDAQPNARYCSPSCTKRAGRRAWKERTDRLVPAHVRAYVYERDRWICWLCTKPIRRDVQMPHPLSHSIDHVVPQSEGGTHDPSNLRAAHFLCNSLRGDRGGGEQLALIG